MEEKNNLSDIIQLLMDNVKKESLAKIEKNKGEIIQNKDIINSLFNLLDYQKTLINQIFLFSEKNKDSDNNNIEYLISINKDILVSMVTKFLINLNTIFNKAKNNGNVKYNIMNKNQNFFKRGKIINFLYSTNNNSNILFSNSFTQYGSPIKKNIEKEFNTNSNSTASFAQNTPNKKIEPIFESDRNSYKYLKKRDMNYNKKNRNNKNLYDRLYNHKEYRCDHDGKRKAKALLYQSYSKSMKDIFIDLNHDYIKNLFKHGETKDTKTKKFFFDKKVKKVKDIY
jgi:hypothetical protein